ncbi:MAG: hypothetical protein WAK12_10025 [Acidimicrobiales bacterium]
MTIPLRKLETTCISCEEDLQHCHGTAIVMDDATHVCSDDPDCTLSVDEHRFVSWDEN